MSAILGAPAAQEGSHGRGGAVVFREDGVLSVQPFRPPLDGKAEPRSQIIASVIQVRALPVADRVNWTQVAVDGRYTCWGGGTRWAHHGAGHRGCGGLSACG